MKFALLGNPNTGKSSIFNLLTGLKQQVGNFPGVTVDKKIGQLQIGDSQHTIIDFPGTYSIYPRSKDEEVVYKSLNNSSSNDFPDAALVVADSSNLRRNLFLFSQIYDLNIPTILILNMSDVALRKGITINIDALQAAFPKAKIVQCNARVGLGKNRILDEMQSISPTIDQFTNDWVQDIDDQRGQAQEAESRYAKIDAIFSEIVSIEKAKPSKSRKIDRVLTHPIWGYLIFASILMVIFQFIFAFASIPMDFIDGSFGQFSSWLSKTLPEGDFSDLISQGIVPGIGGVLVFVPQIALLFFFIAILEESGYLARVVFIMDKLMRPFGLNGKSIVPLMSSVACAIPGVMASRTISDWKERLITILVAPLMSCSARIPVYTLLIALVIPQETVFGVFNLQGLVLFGLYLLGVFAALAVAIILKFLIKSKNNGFLLLELPDYKNPRWKNVGITVLEKVKVFIIDAGKVILAISIILWALANYGPGNSIENAANLAKKEVVLKNIGEQDQDAYIASAMLEKSYIGILGKAIEPVIRPLGYDWKIGISLITSFAAREVFVGSLATIYAVHDESDEKQRLIDRMRNEKKKDGTSVYTIASGLSLMVFYVFAMQCMATLAVVKRETKSWKWPLIQIAYMGVLAYLGAMITFQLFN